MTTTREKAMLYEPKETKNVSELKKVMVDADILEFEGETKEGKPFTFDYIEVEGEMYRVPTSVLKQLKTLLEDNPAMTEYKVIKSGEGMKTEYLVKEVK